RKPAPGPAKSRQNMGPGPLSPGRPLTPLFAVAVTPARQAVNRAIRSKAMDWKFAEAIVYPTLVAAPASYLSDLRSDLAEAGVPVAVAEHDTASIFDWMIPLIQLQGISDSIALSYLAAHGGVGWSEIEAALNERPSRPKLRSYWDFAGCGFRKSTWS